ncbi:phospholipid-binding lipoprotein MlaA [Amphritea atlantica]|jgi:phospholipid-binding lipoprotein MlaA|uniref:Phospholipid-binding lipoprotein MlaA n=1 Tax=Amphritea atlantica TaxID=355243 RepID=A0A1H9D210_9GAMM|nr:VacJ family lipoprotein [Amphritea atlantica]SEQ07409.1 phospholipid-binding lipoprotein MlaA [Amphritea atlantica]
MMLIKNSLLSILFMFSVSAVADDRLDVDPWEGFNRAMFSFNDTVDRYALKPAAQGYKAVTPDIIETGVSNFFGNLSDVGSTLNSALQLKGEDAGQSLARVVFNTTIGLGGIIDVATPMGLPEHNEDFGQTLGYWGVETGPYLVLPLLGPSNIRDGLGLIPDSMVDPVGEVDPIRTRNQLYGLRIIDTRANLLAAEELLTGDRYTAMRDAYLQRREFLVNDGKVASFDQDQF